MPKSGKSKSRRRKRRSKAGVKASRGNGSQPNKRSAPSMGQSIGSMLGGAIGNWAGKGIRSLIGRGDYSEEHASSGLDVEANSIVQPMTASQVPIFSTPEHLHGAVRVQHREYIGDLDTGIALGNLISRRINPSNASLFPWLYSMSKNFEQWLPMGIVFEFVSTAGNAFSGGAANLGDVNMATLYDVAAAPLNTKSEILNHFYSTSAATSQNLMHAVECAPGDTPCLPRYITHPNPLTTTRDSRLEDLGVLYILTTGSQSVYTAGQVWVTYDIVLLKPRLGTAFVTDPPYYNAIELCLMSEMADARGTPLTKAQQVQLATRTGVRPDEEENVLEKALADLSLVTPAPAEEKSSSGWLLSG